MTPSSRPTVGDTSPTYSGGGDDETRPRELGNSREGVWRSCGPRQRDPVRPKIRGLQAFGARARVYRSRPCMRRSSRPVRSVVCSAARRCRRSFPLLRRHRRLLLPPPEAVPPIPETTDEATGEGLIRIFGQTHTPDSIRRSESLRAPSTPAQLRTQLRFVSRKLSVHEGPCRSIRNRLFGGSVVSGFVDRRTGWRRSLSKHSSRARIVRGALFQPRRLATAACGLAYFSRSASSSTGRELDG